PVVEDGVRPGQHPLALRRQAVEALAARHDGHAQFLLELPDSPRQRGLGDAAFARGAREVLLPREGNQVLQLTDVHGVAVDSTSTIEPRAPIDRNDDPIEAPDWTNEQENRTRRK